MPVWPEPLGLAGYIYGPAKKDLQSPVIIEASLPEPFTFRVRVGTVSASSRLEVFVDRPAEPIWSQDFKPRPGILEAGRVHAPVEYIPEHLRSGLRHPVPTCRREIRLNNTVGDWLTVTEIGLQLPTAGRSPCT